MFPPGPEQRSSDPALPASLDLPLRTKDAQGPQAPTLIASMESGVTLTVAGKPVSFLIDTGVTYSTMPAYSRKTKVSQVFVMGVDGLMSTL